MLTLNKYILLLISVVSLIIVGGLTSSPTASAADCEYKYLSPTTISLTGCDSKTYTKSSSTKFSHTENGCTATITITDKTSSASDSGKLGGNIKGPSLAGCVSQSETISIAKTALQDAKGDAASELLTTKLTDIIAKDCAKDPTTAVECAGNWRSWIKTCENTATANIGGGTGEALGGTLELAGQSKEETYLNELSSCLNKKSGTSTASIKSALGPDIFNELKKVKTEAGESFDVSENPEDKTSCNIDNIGWILCPVMSFMGGIVDAAYGWIAGLLTVEPVTASGGLYDAWTIMRNFANIAFVVAFLIIIYSQITGLGLSNYGLKRMLPRLVIAAILVNVSFWICAIAVDVSNILGTSIKAAFDNIEQTLALPEDIAGSSSGAGWAGLVGGTIAVAGVTTALILLHVSVLLPALIAAVLAIVTVFLVLTLRQALIILLIVISPLAFVAYLLPNTEDWFKKWLNLFQTLLLMFPIIAAIFGASALASTIVMQSAVDTEGDGKFSVQVMGALIAILPLALTPIVMKTAGGVLNRFGGFVNNPNKGPFDRMRKGAESYRGRKMTEMNNAALHKQGGFSVRRGMLRRNSRRDAVNSAQEGGLQDAKTNYIADLAANNNGDNAFATKMAGGDNELAKAAVVASALAQQKKAFSEDVSSMEALVKLKFANPQDALDKAIGDGDKTMAVAAQNLLFKSGGSGVSNFRDSIQTAEATGAIKQDSDIAKALKNNVTENHGQYVKTKGADIVGWAGNPENKTLTDSSAGQLSDNDLAAQHHKSIGKLAIQGQITREQADRMLKDPRVLANLDPDQEKHLKSLL